MNPLQRFNWSVEVFIRSMFRITAIDVFRSDYRRNSVYFAIIAMFMFASSTMFYTVYAHDVTTVILSLTMVLLMLEVGQMIIKCSTFKSRHNISVPLV